MKFKDVVLIAAKRTPIGKFLGGLKSYEAYELSATLISKIMLDINLDPGLIDEVILGQVLTTGNGQNPARRAALSGGLTNSVIAFIVNQVCGSGLKSVAIAASMIQNQKELMIIAGGHESMSNAPHHINLRKGKKLGDLELTDTMVSDGLTDVFHSYHMGITAENIADKYGISRKEQDEFAVLSQNKAEIAVENGYFDAEIVPVGELNKDEFIRFGATYESIAGLKPAFKKNGTVTAGNASGVNDGASVVLLTSRSIAESRGYPILAKVVSYAQSGIAPETMGLGPVRAVSKALDYAGWRVSDLDCIESNEAFAVQALAVNREVGWDIDKVNINGGAIALGHPIGASGARCLTTLLHSMDRISACKGIVTLCIGGGMGIAMCLEKRGI